MIASASGKEEDCHDGTAQPEIKGRLTHEDEYQQDAECVQHRSDRCCQGPHDVIQRFESPKEPDDPKHANHANDADWYWYRAKRDQRQADHDKVQDIPANKKEISEPVTE